MCTRLFRNRTKPIRLKSVMPHPKDRNWYALRIFKNFAGARKELESAAVETFIPYRVEESLQNGVKYEEVPLIASLIFVRASLQYVKAFWYAHLPHCMFYKDFRSGDPALIPDAEMEAFMKLTSPLESGAVLFDNDSPEFHKGQRVRITEGRFAGYEGNIYRIGKDRKVIVKVTEHFSFRLDIHPRFLAPLDREGHQA